MFQSAMSIDPRAKQIGDSINQLFETGQAVELRALGQGPVLSGIFDDPYWLGTYAIAAEAEGYQCYFSLNPRKVTKLWNDKRKSWFLLEPLNEMDLGQASKSVDVSERRWLLVDCDPVRPPDVCSTDAEKESARLVMDSCLEWLQNEHGWPEPFICDSGNGWHALFLLDTTNSAIANESEGITLLIKRVLGALGSKFDTASAKIDKTVYDAPRIARLYGTLNSKGMNTQERPHRHSSIIRTGGNAPVSLEQLRSVAHLAPANVRVTSSGVLPSNTVTGAKLLNPESHSQNSKHQATPDAKIVEEAQRWVSQQPPAISGEQGHNQAFRVACGLVVGYGLSIDLAFPILQAYNERCLPPWTHQELNHKLTDAMKIAAERPEEVGHLYRDHERPRKDKDASPAQKISEAKRLVTFAKDYAELWQSPTGDGYATVTVSGHRENHRIKEGSFENWLIAAWLEENGDPPSKAAREEAIDNLNCLAVALGPKYEPCVRIAGGEDGAVYIDLADSLWRAVRIDASGWSITDAPPIRFVRNPILAPLPVPISGGSLELLRELINVTDEDWPLFLACLVVFLRPNVTYPILVVNGPQGSGKTVLSQQTKRLIDPNNVKPKKGIPKCEDDFFLMADLTWLQLFNNMSGLSQDQSDLLCCLVEGTGHAKRTLYSNRNVTLLNIRRPAIANGIENVVVRGDLLSRAVLISLRPLSASIAETELWERFEASRPLILGALYDAVSCAIRNLPSTKLDVAPRLHDFALWATAAEPGLGLEPGTVISALLRNSQNTSEEAAEASLLTPWLRSLLEHRNDNCFEGTVSQLLEKLTYIAKQKQPTVLSSHWWPKTAPRLSAELSRLLPDLKTIGIIVEKGKTGGKRWIRVRLEPTVPSNPSEPSAAEQKEDPVDTDQQEDAS